MSIYSYPTTGPSSRKTVNGKEFIWPKIEKTAPVVESRFSIFRWFE
ncbi:hypothetical protein C4K35_2783 [Pseudomonas chlororaphis subsp. piscium]|nr:hypothetical protein C4K35_2783 [Pseudomonas chlororaphis subsp. piscium]